MRLEEGLARFLLGGLLILFIGLISKTENKYISGIFVLLPVVTAVGYFFMAYDMDSSGMKKVILVSILGLPTVLVFLLTLYFTVDKISMPKALLSAFATWGIAAFIVLTLKKLIGL